MRYVAVLVFAICLFSPQMNLSAAAAETETDLIAMAGTWSGRGYLRPNNFDEKQRVKCKIRVTVDGLIKTVLAGRCATANRSHKLTLEISRSNNGKNITSIGRVSGSNKTFVFRGREITDGFVLKIENPIERNGRTVSSTISIVLHGQNKLSILQRVTDIFSGEKSNALAITLTK